MNIYQENGYESRKDYLRCLSEDFDISHEIVLYLANFFGPNEDFDGLIIALEDYIEENY